MVEIRGMLRLPAGKRKLELSWWKPVWQRQGNPAAGQERPRFPRVPNLIALTARPFNLPNASYDSISKRLPGDRQSLSEPTAWKPVPAMGSVLALWQLLLHDPKSGGPAIGWCAGARDA
jgi:hypothetical protein